MDSLPREAPLDLQRYRAYLLVLARAQDALAGEEASDLVQRTLLAAHTQQHQCRGQTSAVAGLPHRGLKALRELWEEN